MSFLEDHKLDEIILIIIVDLKDGETVKKYKLTWASAAHLANSAERINE